MCTGCRPQGGPLPLLRPHRGGGSPGAEGRAGVRTELSHALGGLEDDVSGAELGGAELQPRAPSCRRGRRQARPLCGGRSCTPGTRSHGVVAWRGQRRARWAARRKGPERGGLSRGETSHGDEEEPLGVGDPLDAWLRRKHLKLSRWHGCWYVGEVELVE